MSDTPEPQDPTQPDPTQADNTLPDTTLPDNAEPEPTSEAPDGLAPSPGLAPPAGIQPPQVTPPVQPQYQPPQYQPPQYQPPQQAQYQQAPVQPQRVPEQAQQAQQPLQAQQAPLSQQPPQFQPGQQFQPGAPQFQPGQQPYQGPPGAYDPSQPVPPKKGLSTGAIFGIVAGGIVLLLLIVAGVVAVGAITSRSSGVPVATEEPSSGITSAPAAVEEYLTAISEGDAERASAFIDETSGSTLLTDEVLAKSNELAPITNIVVDTESANTDETESIVSATFDVGAETVTRDFRVWHYSDDWQIYDGLVNISLSAFDGLEATINGASIGSDYTQAFIGTYQITLGQEQFTVAGDTDTFTLVTEDSATDLYSLQPTLTKAATKEFRKLVTASLTDCVAMTSLATPCGLDVTGPLSDGAMPVDGTIQRTLSADGKAALKKLDPELSYENPTVVSTYEYIQINTTVEADLNGERVTGELMLGGDLLQPSVDFSDAEPKVTWE